MLNRLSHVSARLFRSPQPIQCSKLIRLDHVFCNKHCVDEIDMFYFTPLDQGDGYVYIFFEPWYLNTSGQGDGYVYILRSWYLNTSDQGDGHVYIFGTWYLNTSYQGDGHVYIFGFWYFRSPRRRQCMTSSAAG